MTIITHPTFEQIEDACTAIALRIECETKEIDIIVGLTRGGLIPAVMLSHMMTLPMQTVNYSAKGGRGDGRNYDNHVPHVDGKNILLVDDICDSGKTLHELAASYIELGYNVTTATIYYKVGSVFEPDYYIHKIPADSPWIIFPWER